MNDAETFDPIQYERIMRDVWPQHTNNLNLHIVAPQKVDLEASIGNHDSNHAGVLRGVDARLRLLYGAQQVGFTHLAVGSGFHYEGNIVKKGCGVAMVDRVTSRFMCVQLEGCYVIRSMIDSREIEVSISVFSTLIDVGKRFLVLQEKSCISTASKLDWEM
jgi:hypothetical protein